MSGPAQGKKTISFEYDVTRREIIMARAARLDRSLNRYIVEIIDLWFAQGCPPVDEIEERILGKRGKR